MPLQTGLVPGHAGEVGRVLHPGLDDQEAARAGVDEVGVVQGDHLAVLQPVFHLGFNNLTFITRLYSMD